NNDFKFVNCKSIVHTYIYQFQRTIATINKRTSMIMQISFH
ncbi:unnamed protein product, partial [Heterotrigona itama]